MTYRQPNLSPQDWIKQIQMNCYHPKRRTEISYDEYARKFITCYCDGCETVLAETEESLLEIDIRSHNPDLFYNLRDMAEFDAYGTRKPSERRAWDAKRK